MPKKFATSAALITIFLTGFLIVQPASSATGQTQLNLDLRVCPAVMQYHATTLGAHLMQKGWTQGNIWCPKNYSVPVAGVAVQFFLVARGGSQTLIGANATDSSGVSYLYYVPTAQPGQYWIRAQVAGVNSTASDQEIFQILPAPVEVSVPPLSTIWGVNYTFSLRVTTPCGYPISNLKLAISTFASGQWHSLTNATTDQNGSIRVAAFMMFAPGHYDIQIAFQGLQKGHFWEYLILTLLGMNPDCLGNYIFPGALEIRPRATTLVVNNTIMYYMDPLTLQASLVDQLNMPVIQGNVSFWVQVNSTEEFAGNGMTDTSGTATISYLARLYVGPYNLTAEFAGDAYYLPSNGSNILTVDRGYSTITAVVYYLTGTYTVPATISVTLSNDIFTDFISGVVINFYLSPDNSLGTLIGSATTDVSGAAQISFTPLVTPQVYLLRVVFAGSDVYRPTTGYFAYLVQKDNIQISVENSPTTLYGGWVYLKGRLQDAQGNPLPGKSVEFYLQTGSWPFTTWMDAGAATTDNGGFAKLLFATSTVGSGTYLLKIQFNGDAFYLSGYSTDHVTVNPMKPALSWNAPFPPYVYIGQTVTVNIHLADPAGNPLVGYDVTVTYTATGISDQPLEGVTDSSGDVLIAIAPVILVAAIVTLVILVQATKNSQQTTVEEQYEYKNPSYMGVGENNFPQLGRKIDGCEQEIQDVGDMISPSQYNVHELIDSGATILNVVSGYNEWLPAIFHIASDAVLGSAGDFVDGSDYGVLLYDTTFSGAMKMYNAITPGVAGSWPVSPSMELAYLDCCDSGLIEDAFINAQSIIYFTGCTGTYIANLFATQFFSIALQAGYSVWDAFFLVTLNYNEAVGLLLQKGVYDALWVMNGGGLIASPVLVPLVQAYFGMSAAEATWVAYVFWSQQTLISNYLAYYWDSPPSIAGWNQQVHLYH
ncbi:MAG TPA: Ig-like domain repeat protein [Candidatus Lokiarchaeia archaeon]|nr:Ig-like domain repeat protein [Candidatus Lokiarchaeia archaeon]